MKLDPPPAALLASGQFPEREPSNLPLLDSPAEGIPPVISTRAALDNAVIQLREGHGPVAVDAERASGCLLYTSPSPRDGLLSRMPSSA